MITPTRLIHKLSDSYFHLFQLQSIAAFVQQQMLHIVTADGCERVEYSCDNK